MNERLFHTFHPAVQLIFLVLITLVSFFVMLLFSLIVGLVIYQVPMSEWIGLLDMEDPSQLGLLKFLQITQSVGMFVIPPLVVGALAYGHPVRYLKLDQTTPGKLLLLSFLILLVATPVINLLAIWNESMNLPPFLDRVEYWMQGKEDQARELTEQFLAVDNLGGYLLNVLMVVLIPAFGEEFMFRGVIQRLLQRWFRNPHLAIILTSILFSALHLQFYGFIPRFGLGLLFGYIFWLSGNLWYPILAHFINNFIPVTLVYILGDGLYPEDLDQIGHTPSAWIWAFLGLILTVATLLYFQRKCRETKPKLT